MAICVFLFGAEMWKSQAYAISSTWNNDILLNRELRLWLPIVVSRFNEKLKKTSFVISILVYLDNLDYLVGIF